MTTVELQAKFEATFPFYLIKAMLAAAPKPERRNRKSKK